MGWLLAIAAGSTLLAPGAASAIDMTGFLGLPATQVVDNPVIMNLYWDTSREQWDQDVLMAGGSETFERIDALTYAVARSGYFSELSQYGVNASPAGVAPSVFLGEICGSLGAPPANTQIGHDNLQQAFDCVQASLNMDTSNLVLNVLYPPQVPVGSDFGSCSSPGYHDWSGRSGATTYVPLVCNPNHDPAAIFHHMTHEMVEAMTDPQTPFGYRCYEIDCGNDNEMCDVCGANDPNTDFLKGQIASNGTIANYWDNNLGSCYPLPNPTPPFVPPSSVSICGTGVNMGFSLSLPVTMLPWDLGGCPFWNTVPPVGRTSSMSCQGPSTIYLSAKVTRTNGNAFNAGAPLRAPVGDIVGFQDVQYTEACAPDRRFPGALDCSMTAFASGFTEDWGITPGATITFTVTDPFTGLSTDVPVTAPAASTANLSVVPPIQPLGSPTYGWTFFHDATVVQGQLFSACGFQPPGLGANEVAGAVEGQPVTGSTAAFAENYDPSLPVTFFEAGPTDSFGAFYTPLVTDTAGVQVITLASPPASLQVNVHPVVTGLSPPGSLAGVSETVTVQGAGFAQNGNGARTTVTFNGEPVSNVVVSADGTSVRFTNPALAEGYSYPVVVWVDGVPSVTQWFSVCEPITSCYLSQACNTTIFDGCSDVTCGACEDDGAVCNASHNCCGTHQEPDGTGGCVCAPHTPCPRGTSWDESDCRCIRCIGTSCY